MYIASNYSGSFSFNYFSFQIPPSIIKITYSNLSLTLLYPNILSIPLSLHDMKAPSNLLNLSYLPHSNKTCSTLPQIYTLLLLHTSISYNDKLSKANILLYITSLLLPIDPSTYFTTSGTFFLLTYSLPLALFSLFFLFIQTHQFYFLFNSITHFLDTIFREYEQ